jgi:PAS domain S-box-containing protein
MRLRSILMVLAILAFLSASVGGLLYYSSMRADAMAEAEHRVVSRLEMIKKNLSSYLSENIRPVRTLAGMRALRDRLVSSSSRNAEQRANNILDHFTHSLGVRVCYLMDRKGNTVASSNRNAPDSFVGKNFSFRPYFTQVFDNPPATYLALGTTSKKRGIYFSYPVFDDGEDTIIGLAVIKAPIENIEKSLGTLSGEIVLVVDPQSVIFISTRKDWLYHTLLPLSVVQQQQIVTSRQFGKGPWPWVGLNIDQSTARDREGVQYLLHQADLANFDGWKIYHLQRLDTIAQGISRPLIRIAGPVILALCILIGLSVFLLYRKASHDILRRRLAEAALRESEERYRSIYHDTPAMLHSIDASGRLISVSNYWAEAMGYSQKEVIGHPLTEYLTPASRKYAEETVMPDFFKTGFCRDVSYQFVKKNKTVIDVLLSAIAVRDAQGKIVRSLAVCVDVTKRKKAEEALRKAKEQLSRHSMDLERQVRERTREISGILKYTPDVVYIKDPQGRYVLINARYEEILGLGIEQVRGKTDADILPGDIAGQFRTNDQRIFESGHSLQVEERFLHKDGVHVYLSVKFPLYDEPVGDKPGRISGVCSISTDITAEKQARDQLRRLSAGVMAAQEAERSALARELHDELSQVLTALRMDLAWMANRLESVDAVAARRALAMRDLIDQNIEDVRGLAIRLRPGVLDDLGLVDALEWLTTDFEKRTDITCVFEHQPIPAISDTIATAIYRITQEALTNAGRHAGASHVTVRLLPVDEKLTLSVIDDGRGFDVGDLTESVGLGVVGMRERATLVGGTLSVSSGPGKGTRVSLTVPLTGGKS